MIAKVSVYHTIGMSKKPKRPKDPNQLAKFIVDTVKDKKKVDKKKPKEKNRAAVELGRLGGLKGGKERARRLTKERRREIAKQAANKRWRKS